MFKIIVDDNNLQNLFLVQKSGRYVGKGTIIWDERKDGEIPANLVPNIGGLVRNGNVLELNQAKWDAYQTWLNNKTQAETNKKNRLDQAHQFIKNLDLSGTLTAAQLQNAIKALVILERAD